MKNSRNFINKPLILLNRTHHEKTLDFIDAELSMRRASHQLRQLKAIKPVDSVHISINGRTLLNFSSNDYLGLSRHPFIIQRSIEYLQAYGAGSTASRLICGNYDCFEKIEKKIAALKQVEASLIFSSGFQTNISVISAIANRDSVIFSDQLNHNSLILGIRLARSRVLIYRHNDMNHLEELLELHAHQSNIRKIIVTESVFSMDGDLCDIDALTALAEKYGCLLIIDDAHATGVMGDKGMGLACGQKADLVIGTFGKAAGSFGAYLACTKKFQDYMINCCSGIIYSTAMPPSVLGAIDAALDLIPSMGQERESLLQNAKYLRQSLNQAGYRTGSSTSHIIPVIIGDEESVLDLSEWLVGNGIFITPIRPPTVPKGMSRIRLSLSALHSRIHIDQLINALRTWRPPIKP